MIDHHAKHNGTLSDKVDAAFGLLAEDVITRAERTGTEVLIWRESQIVRLTPEQAREELNHTKLLGQ